MSIQKNDPTKLITNVVIFDGASYLQLRGSQFKFHYPKLNIMHGVEHNFSPLFDDVSKLPIVNQMIKSHKAK